MSPTDAQAMRVEREDLNPCTVLLKVVCTSEQVQNGVKKAVKALSKKIKVPGFRPGAAPVHVMEQMLSPEEIDGYAQEETVNASFKKVTEDEGLDLGGQAMIEEVDFDRKAGTCTYSVKVPLAPKIELGDYKGLSAQRIKVTVTDDEIGRQIDELRAARGKKTAVDRGIKNGDNALVNIKAEGEEGDGRNFMVVVGQTFEDLDKALQGMQTDDIKSVALSFPDSFQEADLRGKKLECKVTVRSVSAIEIPELDDEFAKSVDLEDVDELKQKIREHIIQSKSDMAQQALNEQLMDRLLESSTVHVADTTWEGVADRRLAEIKEELKKQGSTLEQYAKHNGMSEDDFVTAQRNEARAQVQRAVLIERIFREEGMEVTDRDANDQFIRIATENRVPASEIKKFAKEFGPQIRDEVVYRTMYWKVMKLINENASITEVEVPDGPGGGN